MRYYKDELVPIWRRSFYSTDSDNAVQEILNDSIDPDNIEYLNEFSYQESPSKVEIYNQETDELIYNSELDNI